MGALGAATGEILGYHRAGRCVKDNLDGAVAVFGVGWIGGSLSGVEAFYASGLGRAWGSGRPGWEGGRGENAGESGSLENERLI